MLYFEKVYNLLRYSETCVQRPPSGPHNSGRGRCPDAIYDIYFNTGPQKVGRCGQEVAIRSWLFTQV